MSSRKRFGSFKMSEIDLIGVLINAGRSPKVSCEDAESSPELSPMVEDESAPTDASDDSERELVDEL